MTFAEFDQRTEFKVTQAEYDEIEIAYYGFYGDKDSFCRILNDLYFSYDAEAIDAFLMTCYMNEKDDYSDRSEIEYCLKCYDADYRIMMISDFKYHFLISAKNQIAYLQDRLNKRFIVC